MACSRRVWVLASKVQYGEQRGRDEVRKDDFPDVDLTGEEGWKVRVL